MRITLDLDDDLLRAARRLAAERSMTLGQVVSELARKSLASQTQPKVRNGVPLFVSQPAARRPGPELVNELRDDP